MKKTKTRKSLLKAMEQQLKTAASVDICFMLDCTGSMGSYISNMASQMNALISSIDGLYPDLPLRLAFIGYRNHGDKRILFIQEFTFDIDIIKKSINDQKAIGGGDGLCDIIGALHMAKGLEWQSATRLLFHIGDMPCHGLRFHDGLCDSYPTGDPNGLNVENSLHKLSELNILYYFGRITFHTDKMIRIFNQEIMMQEYVVTIDVTKADNMMATVISSAMTTMSATLSSSISTSSKIEKSELVLIPDYPAWLNLKSEKVSKFALSPLVSVAEVVSGCSGSPYVVPIPVTVGVKVALQPFAKGGCRAAYYAQELPAVAIWHILASKEQPTAIIHKVPLSNKSKDICRERLEDHFISTHHAALSLAQEFNAMLPHTSAKVCFNQIFLIQYLERVGTPFCIQETALIGKFEKYNSNSGLVSVNPTASGVDHDVIQAFSHWTMDVTSRQCLVVDCQGVFDSSKNCFWLTDPAIHCIDLLRFGGTNLGKMGMERFWKTHRCNWVCKMLCLSEKFT